MFRINWKPDMCYVNNEFRCPTLTIKHYVPDLTRILNHVISNITAIYTEIY